MVLCQSLLSRTIDINVLDLLLLQCQVGKNEHFHLIMLLEFNRDIPTSKVNNTFVQCMDSASVVKGLPKGCMYVLIRGILIRRTGWKSDFDEDCNKALIYAETKLDRYQHCLLEGAETWYSGFPYGQRQQQILTCTSLLANLLSPHQHERF